MRNIRKIIMGAVIAGLVTASFTGCIEKTTAAKRSTIVAKGDGITVTMGELIDSMKSNQDQIKQKYGTNYANDPDAISELTNYYDNELDTLVEQKILDDKAKKSNLIPNPNNMDAEIQKQIDSIKKSYYGNDEQKFEAGIKEQGYTLDQLKNEIKEEIKTNPKEIGRNRVIAQATEKVTVSDTEIQNYYTQNKSNYTKKPGANIAHILVNTQQEAINVKNRLAKGEKFEDLAKELSKDTTNKDNGGSYGYVTYDANTLSTEVMTAAKTLAEGAVSDPIKTSSGFEIIKVTGVTKTETVSPLTEVKDTVKSTLLQSKQQTEYSKDLAQWKKDYNIKTYESRIPKNFIF